MSKYEHMSIPELAKELIKWYDREEMFYELGYKKEHTDRQTCRRKIDEIIQEIKKEMK